MHVESPHHHPHGSDLAHWFSHLVGGHSHDAADQIDDALEADAAGRRALWISLGILGVTAAIQAGLFVLTDSVALLGDTLHNVGDALTAVPILVAFSLARRPATRRYTYGFGRAEDVAGLFVVAMIALSAAVAAYEAIVRLLNPHPVQQIPILAAAGIVGFLGNEIVARYRISVGRRIGSAALTADGLHARTDGFTSLAVVASAGGAAVGWDWADPVIGLLIAVAILGVLRSAVGQVGQRLLDGVDPASTITAQQALAEVPGVVSVPRVQLRWIGHGLHAEADVEVAPELAVVDACALADQAAERMRDRVRRLQVVRVRALPARPGGGSGAASG